MLSLAGNGPGGKCATPSRHEPKVAVALLWQRLRRLCLVRRPAAGCGLLAEAEAVDGRGAAAASRATGSSRPHKKMDLALPAAAYPAPEKGCRPPLPWTPGPQWHGDRFADRLCCQPRWEGAWRRRHAHRPLPSCQAPGAEWSLPSPRTHVHVAGPNPRTEGPSHGCPKCRGDTAAGAPAPAVEAGCPDPAAPAAAAVTHHCEGARVG